MMIRRSTAYCPTCNAGFWVEAGIFADDHRYRCANCGAMIDIKLRWGKIASVSAAPVVSEQHEGYGGNCKAVTSDEARVGNAEYWKKKYGADWLQAHDAWERKDDAWFESLAPRPEIIGNVFENPQLQVLSKCCNATITIGDCASECDECGTSVNPDTGKSYNVKTCQFGGE